MQNDIETIADDECEEKIKKLNEKLTKTADELEEISNLYANSVKDGLNKAKKIKQNQKKIKNN